MSNDMERIAKKIKAILAKAESSTFDGEAATFLAKAQAMMAEHGIDMATVEHADDPIGGSEDELQHLSTPWQRQLLTALARLYYCETIWFGSGRGSTGKMGIYGKATGRILVREMWPYVSRAVGKKATDLLIERRKEYREAYNKGRDMGIPAFMIVDKIGKEPSRERVRRDIGNALAHRIFLMVAERKEAEQEGRGDGTSLVLVDQVDAYIDETFGRLDTMRQRTTKFTKGAQQAAESINLDDQVGGNAGGQKALT